MRPGAAAGPGLALDPRTILRARAALRLALDPTHEGSGASAPGPYHEEVMELRGHLTAEIDHRARPWLRLTLGGRLGYRLTARRPEDVDASYLLFNGSVHRSDLEAELLESYLAFSRPGLELRVGMITTVLGATDLASPNDVLTARDLRRGLLEPEAARLPVPQLRLEGTWRRLSLTGCWLFAFRPHRADLYGSDFSLFGPLAPPALQWLGALADGLSDDSIESEVQGALRQTRSPRPFADSSFALRAALDLGGWDLALQVAWLHERLPVFRLERTLALTLLPLLAGGQPGDGLTGALTDALAGGASPIEGSYHRQHQAGLSLAGGLGPLALSLDLSYLSREALPLGGPIPLIDGGGGWLATAVDSKMLATSAGLSYLRGEELLITVEGWHRVALDLAGQPLVERPPLLLGGPHWGGVALLARYGFTALRLDLQLLAHLDLANRSFLIAPRASWRWGDHLRLLVGAELYEGAETSLGGRLSQNDQVFLAVEGYL